MHTHEQDTDNLNKTLSIRTLKQLFKLPKSRALKPDSFTSDFYQPLMEKMIPIHYFLSENRSIENIFS